MNKSLTIVLSLALFLASWISPALAQHKINDAVNEMIRSHPFRFGIFRLRPALTLNSGYDSNSFNSAEQSIEDYYFSVAPGGNVAVKLGRRAFLSIDEELNFVYYRDLEQLRDIYNTTSANFVTGSRKLLVDINGSYLDKKAPVNSEFDVPAQQKSTAAGASLAFELTRRIDLNFQFATSRSIFKEDVNIETNLPIPPDTDTKQFGLGVDYKFAPKIDFSVESSIGRIERLNISPISQSVSNFRRIFFGISARANRIAGHAKIGFGQTEEFTAVRNKLTDFLIDTDITFQARRRLAISLLLKRERTISAFLENGFRLTTEGGLQGTVPLTRRFFIDGLFRIGKNDYGDQAFLTSVPINKDNYFRSEGALDFLITRNVILRTGITYWNRDSDDPTINKDRLAAIMSITLEPSP